jgi:TRAP-type C4-dicarboxylate transport system substrate-binding protein
LPVWVWRALAAARKVPWTRVIAAVGWLATVGKQYWDRLAPDERREVFDLLRKSKGEKSNLTTTEQDRVAALLEKIRENPGFG